VTAATIPTSNDFATVEATHDGEELKSAPTIWCPSCVGLCSFGKAIPAAVDAVTIPLFGFRQGQNNSE